VTGEYNHAIPPPLGTSFNHDGIPTEPAFEKHFVRFATELEWYAEATRARRATGVPY
jgi:hypothetical protein